MLQLLLKVALQNIPSNKIVAGFPAKDISLWKKEIIKNSLKK